LCVFARPRNSTRTKLDRLALKTLAALGHPLTLGLLHAGLLGWSQGDYFGTLVDVGDGVVLDEGSKLPAVEVFAFGQDRKGVPLLTLLCVMYVCCRFVSYE
jgi:hypothetical protein